MFCDTNVALLSQGVSISSGVAKRSASNRETGLTARAPREQEVAVPPLPPVQAPLSLSQVLGQEKPAALLRDAVASGRVHHAWIFQGPQGVGKFTLALAFASLILDETTGVGLTGELAPDPDSRVQQLLRSGTHPDLAVIKKELAAYHPDAEVRKKKQTSISIDVLRHFMLEPGALTPSASGKSLAGRVFIIDEAEYLSGGKEASQNAILKFLEEPPQRTVMILVCNAPELLLPTIRSRCQRVTCASLGPAAMNAWVKQAMKDGRLNVEPSQQQWLLDFAAGSPGAIMRCVDTGIYAWWQRIEPMLKLVVAGKHSVDLGPAMAELTEQWAKAWVESHDNASKEAANRAGAEWMLRVLAWFWTKRLRETGDQASRERVLRSLDAIRDCEREVDSNVSQQFAFDKLAAAMV